MSKSTKDLIGIVLLIVGAIFVISGAYSFVFAMFNTPVTPFGEYFNVLLSKILIPVIGAALFYIGKEIKD